MAPDLFFQNQVYRHDGGAVLLPPGRFVMTYGRCPEYRLKTRDVEVPAREATTIEVSLSAGSTPRRSASSAATTTSTPRAAQLHIAGGRYQSRRNLPPGQGRRPERRLHPHLGAVLRLSAQVLCPDRAQLERAADGHQLRRRGQRFWLSRPGPRLPVESPRPNLPGLRGHGEEGLADVYLAGLAWAKAQGAVTGYAHSASGLEILPKAAAERLIAGHDKDANGSPTRAEAAAVSSLVSSPRSIPTRTAC